MQAPFAPRRAGEAERAARDRDLPRGTAKSRTGSTATRPRPRDRRDVRRRRRLEGRRLVGLGRPDRERSRRRQTGVVTEAWTGPQVAWKMARGSAALSAAGRSTPSASGSRSASSSCSGSPTSAGRSAAEPRPARPALVLGLALVLQPRRDLHERPARVPAAGRTCSGAWSGVAWRGGPELVACGLAAVAARGRDGLPHGLPRRAQRHATRT